MDVERVRNGAIAQINQAIELDNQNKLSEAFECYVKGIGNLLLSSKYDNNVVTKRKIWELLVQYIDRAEAIKKQIANNDKTKPTDTNKRPEAIGEDVDDTSKLRNIIIGTRVQRGETGVEWSDVVGLKATKDSLYEAVMLPKKFPSMFSGNRQPWSAILMYGPPGTGKSFLAKAVATESESTFFSVSASDIMSKWQGESEKIVKMLFRIAREESPSVIFIDEIDSIAGERSDGEHDSSRRVKTELMTEMEGVGKNNKDILILAATNTPWSLDSAFRRRFQKRIFVSLPSKAARSTLFKNGIGNNGHTLTNNDFNYLGSITDGYSGSDIANVVRESHMIPLRKCRNAKQFKSVGDKFTPIAKYPNCSKCPLDLSNNRAHGKVCEYCGAHCKIMDDFDDKTLELPPLTVDDLVGAIENMHKSVATSELTRYEEWTKEFGQEGK